MGLKIYLAAPWRDRAEMNEIGIKFENAGNTITHKWWLIEDLPEVYRSPDLLASQALKDYFGVSNADLVVVFNTSKSEGKAVEQGIALAQEKAIVAIGVRGAHSANVFHYLPNYFWVKDVDEAIKSIPNVWLRWNKARSNG